MKRFRTTAVLALSALISTALGFVPKGKGIHMLVTEDGVPAGSAFASSVIQADGSLVETLNVHLGQTSVLQKVLYDRTGRPLTRDYRADDPRKGTQTLSVTYEKSVITIKGIVGGKSLPEKRFPIPKGKHLACGALFWFKRDKPKLGASVSWDEFDLQTFKWAKVTTRYLGDKPFRMDYGTEKIHELAGLYGVRYVDYDGDLVWEALNAGKHTFRYVKVLKPVNGAI